MKTFERAAVETFWQWIHYDSSRSPRAFRRDFQLFRRFARANGDRFPPRRRT